MAVEITAQDVTDAEDFLAEYAADNVPQGDYSDGSALRDLVVRAIAFNFAYLRATADQLRVRQSLQSIQDVDTTDDSEAADDAVDEILSNWFATRNRGSFVTFVAHARASTQIDIRIPAGTTFYKDADIAFLLNNDGEDLTIPAEDLVPLFDTTGAVTDYTFQIPLVAEQRGTAYAISAGVFAGFDDFSPYVTQVEAVNDVTGGTDVETTDEYIERAETLVTVRNLINARSNDAVLRDEFPEIVRITTVGMGDTEMVRDLVKEDATGVELHVGGHMDTFVSLPVTETSFTGVVGARYTRPDGLNVVFRDSTVVTGTPNTFPSLGVTEGMVLHVVSGLTVAPHDYKIVEVRDTELLVSSRVPFPVATDESNTPGAVEWSIGKVGPSYSDVVAVTTTGDTSRSMQTEGRVTLPGGPVYRILDVSIDDPSDPDADPDDGLVHFEVRTNTTPTDQVAPDNEYQLTVSNPLEHQSAKSFAEVVVGIDTDPAKYDGLTCKVTYETLASFTEVSAYVLDRRRRVSAANPLPRGYHPAYVSFTMEYRPSAFATEEVDDDAVRTFLVSYINSYDPAEVLSLNQLTDAVRANFENIGRVYPFILFYDVHMPDGRVISFQSSEEITVPSTSDALAAVLEDPTALTNPLDYGVTDDVIRYLTSFDSIQVQARS